MYYILLGVALILVYYIVMRFVSSLFKGCTIVFGIAILIGTVYIFVLSLNEPVELFDMYVIDNFRVTRIDR